MKIINYELRIKKSARTALSAVLFLLNFSFLIFNSSAQSPIRIAGDSAYRYSPSLIDTNTLQSVQFVRGDWVVFEVGLFDRGMFRSNNINQFTNVTLAIFDAQNSTNAPLMAETITNGSKFWNTNCSVADWNNGPTQSTNQNIAFVFSNALTFIPLNGQASQSYWITIFGVTTNNLRGRVTFLEAPVTVYDGPRVDGYVPPNYAIIGGAGPPGISETGPPNTILTYGSDGQLIAVNPAYFDLGGDFSGTNVSANDFSVTNTITFEPNGEQIGDDGSGNLSIYNPDGVVNINGSSFTAGGDGTLQANLFNGDVSASTIVDSGLSPSSLVMTSSGEQLQSVTLGTGLSFSGSTLNATGGGGGGSFSGNPTNFTTNTTGEVTSTNLPWEVYLHPLGGGLDDTPQVQAAMNLVYTQGSVEIYFSKGKFLFNGPSNNACGSILTNPFIAAPSGQPTTFTQQPILHLHGFNGIPMWGGFAPSPNLFNAPPDPTNNTVFYVTNNGYWWTNSFLASISNGGAIYPAASLNNVHLIMDNIVIETATNASLAILNLAYQTDVELKNIMIDPVGTNLFAPTHTNNYGIILPEDGDASLVTMDHCFVVGQYNGVKLGELLVGGTVDCEMCINGLVEDSNNFPNEIDSYIDLDNQNGIAATINSANAGSLIIHNWEIQPTYFASIGTWAGRQMDITNVNNNMFLSAWYRKPVYPTKNGDLPLTNNPPSLNNTSLYQVARPLNAPSLSFQNLQFAPTMQVGPQVTILTTNILSPNQVVYSWIETNITASSSTIMQISNGIVPFAAPNPAGTNISIQLTWSCLAASDVGGGVNCYTISPGSCLFSNVPGFGVGIVASNNAVWAGNYAPTAYAYNIASNSPSVSFAPANGESGTTWIYAGTLTYTKQR